MSADLPQPPRLAFYHDGRHPLIYMYEPPIQRQQYEQGVDELLGTPVDALMFCLGDGRTVLHDTKVGELWGHNVERWPHLVFRRAHQNAQAMIDRGEDPLMVICERAQAKGLPIYPTLLVQQGSGVRGEDCRGSDSISTTKPWRLGPRLVSTKTGLATHASTSCTRKSGVSVSILSRRPCSGIPWMGSNCNSTTSRSTFIPMRSATVVR
jgi:hypothetical protein